MKAITGAITADREFTQTLLALDGQFAVPKPLPLSVSGLSDGARDAFLAETFRHVGSKYARPSLLIASDEGEAMAHAAFLRAQGIDAVYYPPRDFVFLNISASHDVERERLSVLFRIACGESVVVVCTPYAASLCTLPPAKLQEQSLSLSVGDELSPDVLAQKLVDMGFAHVDLVEGVGQFARRGGIFDLFPATATAPVRMEFFGDEIDRMGTFDPITQRMEEAIGSVCILPAREVLPTKEDRAAILEAHQALCKKAGAEALPSLSVEVECVSGGLDILFADRYLTLIYPDACTLFDYFTARPTFALVISDSGMQEKTETLLRMVAEEGTSFVERGLLAPKYNRFCAPYGDMTAFLAENLPIYVSSFGNSYGGKMAGLFGFRARRTVSYFDKPLLLIEDVKNLIGGFYRVMILTASAAEQESTVANLRQAEIAAFPATSNEPFDYSLLNSGAVAVVVGQYAAGFELLVPKIAVLSVLPDETARAPRRRRTHKAARAAGQKIISYADLSVGDYVVHTVHGIGVFEGMQQIKVDGVTKDYITLRYAGTDQLFLPADRLEMIAKYIGAKSEDGTVKLSKLGGTDWQKAKSRARASAKDMAKQLVSLYAARQRRPGFAYQPEGDLERAFADSFEFEETEPQLQAISEIMGDMEKPIPMDRLLCGDVGFGKTEVALRAAFKAICGGKQVAVLVPTTILAMQHYQTALSRMRGYPVNVAMISRLRTPKEQKTILRRLARGEIDLIIGTHSLLSKNVAFRDLGLLIVDEEQRFGVGQKEKLKLLAQDVDVLTLTATPIPRTLNMAMSGIRDMSVLDEAPADRHPVQTYVLEHDDMVIFEAVRKELARGGQVLYLYNRVQSMERPAARLQARFPEARITIAHGKMDKEELEDIWQALVRGEIDILVCSTIIETGVDLPNANTLVIEDADRMGLSQLHQIRGRVGRSGRQAYAYFTFRRGKELTEVANKRLKAIREYAAFGAGFKIALRDLEIRGAGNLLGAEQHGHIDSVGYDLYVRILNEAILEEKGTLIEPPFESRIEMAVDANIPEGYITTSAERMEMYKKISYIRQQEDVSDVYDELSDRYGDVPMPVQRLLYISACRSMASRAKIALIEWKDGLLRFVASPPDLSVWSVLFATRPALRFSAGSTAPAVLYKLGKGEDIARAAYEIMLEYTKISCEEKEQTT